MYHNSTEWYNLWLIYCKKYQPNNPDSKLEPFEITEPSKYKPSPENCIPTGVSVKTLWIDINPQAELATQLDGSPRRTSGVTGRCA